MIQLKGAELGDLIDLSGQSRHYNGRRDDAGQKISRRNLAIFSYIAMLLAWVFDFRSEGAGQGLAIQLFFITAYTFSALAFYINASYSKLYYIIPFLFFSILFFSVGVVSGISLGQDYYGIFRNSFNVLLYSSSVVSSFLFLRMMRNRLPFIRKILALLSIFYLVSTFIIVLLFQGGLDFSKSRYEIIGTSVAFALSYLALLFRFSLAKFEFFSAFFSFSIVMLSVTRAWLVVLLAQVAVLVILGGGLSRNLMQRVAVPTVLLIFAIASLELTGVPVVERWTERVFASDRVGVDPTTLSRQRQIEDMIDKIDKRPLVGNGFYGESSYWIEKELGGFDGIESGYGYGHHQDLSVIFIGGFLGGAPLLIWQYCILFLALKFLFRLRKYNLYSDFAALGMVSSLAVIGTIVYGQFGGTFGSRGTTLWYGVATGLLLGLHSLLPSRAKTILD